MKKGSISARFYLVYYARFEVNVEGPGDVLSAARLREESGETTVVSRGRVRFETAIGLRRKSQKGGMNWCQPTYTQTMLEGI